MEQKDSIQNSGDPFFGSSKTSGNETNEMLNSPEWTDFFGKQKRTMEDLQTFGNESWKSIDSSSVISDIISSIASTKNHKEEFVKKNPELEYQIKNSLEDELNDDYFHSEHGIYITQNQALSLINYIRELESSILLSKYIKYVKEEEGCDFIENRSQSDTPFTDKEWSLLGSLSQNLDT